MKRRVDVTVMGMPLSVRTEKDDAWVHGLAAQVSRRLEELRRSAKNASAQQLAILLALTMAEELAVEREKNADLEGLTSSALQRVRLALAALDEDQEAVDEEEEEEVVIAEA